MVGRAGLGVANAIGCGCATRGAVRALRGDDRRKSAQSSSRGPQAARGKRGDADPLQDRIYLEDGGRGNILQPDPVPVTHSAAFLQRSRGVWQEDDKASSSKTSDLESGATSGVEWLVKGADRRLDVMESSPPEVAKAFNDAISSDTGKSVRKGVVQAAKLTVDAGVVVAKGAAKGAVPVVSWVVKEGTKAIISSATSKKNNPRTKK